MTISRFPKWIAALASFVGIFLHAYTSFFKATGGLSTFTVGLFIWSSLPYVLCLLISLVGKGRPFLGFCGATLAFVGDLNTYYSVFVLPTSSTAAIGLLFSPLVGLFFWVPLGVLVGYVIGRWLDRKAAVPN